MRPIVAAWVLGLVSAPGVTLGASGLCPKEILQLALAIELTELPIALSNVDELVTGETKGRILGSYGVSEKDGAKSIQKDYHVWILTDPKSTSGHYRLQLNLGEGMQVTSMKLLFHSPEKLRFELVFPEHLRRLVLTELRREMLQRRITPREMAAEAEPRLRNEVQETNTPGI